LFRALTAANVPFQLWCEVAYFVDNNSALLLTYNTTLFYTSCDHLSQNSSKVGDLEKVKECQQAYKKDREKVTGML